MTGPPVTLRLPRGLGTAALAPVGDVTAAIAAHDGRFEPHVMATLVRLLPRDGVAIDVGANVGAIALVLARAAPDGRVIAFEASPATVPVLRANLAANGEGGVEVVPVALGDRGGSVRLSAIAAGAGGSFVSPREAHGEGAEVAATTLDDWVEARGLERLDLIKIDVEGSEPRVLDGARRTLARHRPALVVECNPAALLRFQGVGAADLLERLAGHGEVGWIAGRRVIRPVRGPDELVGVLRATGIADLVVVPGGLPRTGARPLALAGRVRLATRLRASRGSPPRAQFVVEPGVRVEADGPAPDRVPAGGGLEVAVRVRNGTGGWLSSAFPHPVLVTHRWIRPDGGGPEDEPRTPLPVAIPPGGAAGVRLAPRAPGEPGRWTLLLRMVQEGYVWLDALDPGAGIRLDVLIEAPGVP
ncbi:MAG TPA: FkbM family methyltransferase [Miltoncostaeaceae bacterium]|nr:FkbM family methyltransferase [Miltoncostaeaceae bacterium]